MCTCFPQTHCWMHRFLCDVCVYGFPLWSHRAPLAGVPSELDGAQMKRVLSEELHVTNQDWARLPVSQNIFCWFKRPLRLCSNGKAWWGHQRKPRNTVADMAGWVVIYHQSIMEFIIRCKRLIDPPCCQWSLSLRVMCLALCCPVLPIAMLPSSSCGVFFFSLPSLVILCLAPCLHIHKMEGGEVPIQNSFVALPAPLPAQQLQRGPRGALSQLYMQMSLHLGNSVGMLGPGAYLCKSQGDSRSTTQSRPRTPLAISPHPRNNAENMKEAKEGATKSRRQGRLGMYGQSNVR